MLLLSCLDDLHLGLFLSLRVKLRWLTGQQFACKTCPALPACFSNRFGNPSCLLRVLHTWQLGLGGVLAKAALRHPFPSLLTPAVGRLPFWSCSQHASPPGGGACQRLRRRRRAQASNPSSESREWPASARRLVAMASAGHTGPLAQGGNQSEGPAGRCGCAPAGPTAAGGCS